MHPRLAGTSGSHRRHFFASQHVAGYGYRAGKSDTPHFHEQLSARQISRFTTKVDFACVSPAAGSEICLEGLKRRVPQIAEACYLIGYL